MAHGVDRGYQIQCRDVLIFREPRFQPYSADGIDVPFDFGGTTWKLDVALRAPEGEVLIAECRRQKNAVKQEDVLAFATKVELLRKALNVLVAGVFIAKREHQIGAIKVGAFAGITVAILAEGETAPGFAITFLRYDREREDRCRDVTLHVPPMRVDVRGGDADMRVGKTRVGGGNS
jgi:hypothetical protein